jgi:hypothetical protein
MQQIGHKPLKLQVVDSKQGQMAQPWGATVGVGTLPQRLGGIALKTQLLGTAGRLY